VASCMTGQDELEGHGTSWKKCETRNRCIMGVDGENGARSAF